MIVLKDNVLAPKVVDYLSHITLHNEFPWYFISNSAHAMDNKINQGDHFSLSHMLFRDEKNFSLYSDIFRTAVLDIQDKFNINDYKIFRLRLAMQLNMNKAVINPPHVDEENLEHKSCILYLNDSDGDTCFYKKNKIFKKVSPKKNRVVLFDGNIFHSSSKPVKHQYRIILNINFIK